MRHTVVSGIETVRKVLYRGPVKKAVVALGLESALKTAYSGLLGTVSDEETVTHEIAGIPASFYVSTGLEVQRFRNLMDESDVLESLLADSERDDVFYDVGANVGLYTCFLSQAVDRTVAFEPHPVNLDRLEENVALNELTNVTVRPEALSDTDGTAELAVPGAAVEGEGTHALVDSPDSESVEVDTARGDSLAGRVPRPDVIKIDVEGAEMDVLRGLEETLDDCRLVYCETHPGKLRDRGYSEDDVHKLLTQNGFETEDFEHRGTERFVRAERKS